MGASEIVQKSRKNALEIGPRTGAENHPKIELKWRVNGGKNEPKRHPRIDVFLARFWNGSGNIGGLRVGCEWAAGGLRVGHFLQRIPQGGPRARGVIKQKIGKDGERRSVVTGSNTPRAVGSANFLGSLVGSQVVVVFMIDCY